MGTLIIAGLLFIVAMALMLARRVEGVNPTLMVGAGVIALLLSVGVTISALVQVVDPGERALVVEFGEIHNEVLTEGMHFVVPWADIETVDCRVRKQDETQDAETVDTQTVKVTLWLNWRPDTTKLVELWRKWGPEFANRQIPLATQEVLKSAVAKFKVADLITKRNLIKTEVESELIAWLAEDGIIVEAVAIGDIDFSDGYDGAIEAKQIAEQRTLQAQNELERARKDAERTAAAAKGEADAAIEAARGRQESAILAAKGEADALRIRAEAQANYNAQVSASLSPMLVQMEYMKTWNGQLPQYMMTGDGGVSMLLPISGK